MTLKTPAEQAASDQSAHYSTDLPWVATVTYNGESVTAKYAYGEDLDEQTGTVMAVMTLWVQKTDVETPTYRDTVVVGSATWRVRRISQGDSQSWEIMLYSAERPVI